MVVHDPQTVPTASGVTMPSINLAVVYGKIQKLATNSGEPGAARSRIDLFQNDVAGLDPSERAEYLSRLREILVTASQRHPGGSAHDTFQEAINALSEAADQNGTS